MGRVGIRELKQNASAVVARAAAGETVTITDRGKPVAQITPLPTSRLDQLIAAGLAIPPKGDLRDLPEPKPIPGVTEEMIVAALEEQRADRELF
jgi:prevent-host-death family protein